MRLFTKNVGGNEVSWSYYVQFLRWLALKLEAKADIIVDKHF